MCNHTQPATPEPFLCFQRRVPGDVLIGPHKIAGSAQRRHRGAVLATRQRATRALPFCAGTAGHRRPDRRPTRSKPSPRPLAAPTCPVSEYATSGIHPFGRRAVKSGRHLSPKIRRSSVDLPPLSQSPSLSHSRAVPARSATQPTPAASFRAGVGGIKLHHFGRLTRHSESSACCKTVECIYGRRVPAANPRPAHRI